MANFRDVADFHDKFGHGIHTSPGHLTRRKLQERIDFLQEELTEFIQACESQDLAEQADALVDLVYVAMGTAYMLGLPWDALWNDVHAANMRKVPGVGKRGHAIDCIKPPGWVGPSGHSILVEHGYCESQRERTWEYGDDEAHKKPDNL